MKQPLSADRPRASEASVNFDSVVSRGTAFTCIAQEISAEPLGLTALSIHRAASLLSLWAL